MSSLSMSYDEHQGPAVERDTDNETMFHADDAPTGMRLDGYESKRNHYQRLSTLNTGHYNGKWGDQEKIRSQDNKAMYDAIAAQLDLQQYIRTEGRQLVGDLNLREFGRPVSLIVYCICARLYNQVAADEYRYHPNRSDENNPDRFLEVADGLDLNDSDINSVYNKLEGEV